MKKWTRQYAPRHAASNYDQEETQQSKRRLMELESTHQSIWMFLCNISSYSLTLVGAAVQPPSDASEKEGKEMSAHLYRS